MYEGMPRPRAGTEYRRRRAEPTMIRRPDRIAFLAVVMAVIGMIAAATSAHAGPGGDEAAEQGLEPRLPGPKPGVLPLDHSAGPWGEVRADSGP